MGGYLLKGTHYILKSHLYFNLVIIIIDIKIKNELGDRMANKGAEMFHKQAMPSLAQGETKEAVGYLIFF